ncbi:uncharacterized protein K452DRAFT_292649 [Aplosporella prunicola CBS 121167]|uniref:NADH dehydrogenase [ubiquinone] iron-sulfur protein 5 n=1 Tax=Aplosporella prunicola CBS 121167 TaxID=1176127 RepID=A0A6A6AY12_9PEZI|nr:uncharacterized protein K452DRAFT_292649 [Aplosporella prunicola CBS 121167]KAF2136148.1 hypothetical protein K452DRAFT_292649 [Aplosporella prunicola CBS 121167]
MSSGYGLNGGPSRCFSFWQEVLACYVTNSSEDNTAGKAKCLGPLDDYYECLHHKKEYAKAFAMQSAYRQAEAAGNGRPADAPKPSEVRSLGLLEGAPETKNVSRGWFGRRESNGAY